MALTEKSRSALYQGLTDIIDEEAVQEMLSYFPARDVEEPVTKEFLRAGMGGFKTEVRGDIDALRVDMAEFKTEIRADMSKLRGEMAALERRLSDRIGRAQAWNILAMVAIASAIIAAVRI